MTHDQRALIMAVYEAAKEGRDLRAETLVVLPEWAVQIEEAHRDGVGARTVGASWPRLTHAEWRAAPGAPMFLHPWWGF